MNITNRIRHLRKTVLKMTQEEFSQRLNISRSNLGSIETGRVALTDRVIADVCRIFNVCENWLRTGEGAMYRDSDEGIFSAFANEYGLTEDERTVARYCLDLTPDQRAGLIRHIRALALELDRNPIEADAPAIPDEGEKRHSNDLTAAELADIDSEVERIRAALIDEKKQASALSSFTVLKNA